MPSGALMAPFTVDAAAVCMMLRYLFRKDLDKLAAASAGPQQHRCIAYL